MNSRRKGADGERELARKLKEYGYDTRRGGQFGYGSETNPDVAGLPGIHIECKRVEKLNLYDAIAQAKKDAVINIPAVFHRKNDHEWLVTLTLEDFMAIYREWEATL